MENVAIKGRGGNDVQHKNWKGKILRIWITINRHGCLHRGEGEGCVGIHCAIAAACGDRAMSVCKNWENVNSGTLSLVSLWLLLFKNSHFILYKISWNWNVWWRNLDKQRLTLNWRKWSLKLTQQTQVCLWIVWSWSKRDRYPQISVGNN